jgi:hypothetical protein
MMNLVNSNHDWIDRLVSGDASDQEYRQYLLTLEANPRLWRDCALAFLQEQALGQDLKRLSHTSVDWTAAPSASTAHSTFDLRAASSSTVTMGATTSDAGRMVQRWGVLAAMVLLSFGIGWSGSMLAGSLVSGSRWWTPEIQTAQNEGDLSTDNLLVNNAAPVQGSSASPAARSSNPGNRPDLENFLRNNHNQFGNSSASWLPVADQIPSNLRELERSGRIRIESSNALIPIDYRDGTSVLVPVQQLQIVPTVYAY